MGIDDDIFVSPEAIPERLFCVICQEVACEAVITNCEHIYCNQCMLLWQEEKKDDDECECPICRKEISCVIEAQNARKIISIQTAGCKCGWSGRYYMYHTHIARECELSTEAEKKHAKKAIAPHVRGLSSVTTEDLKNMGVQTLKKILMDEMKRKGIDLSYVSKNGIEYDYNKFVEKNEFVTAVFDILHHNEMKNNSKNNSQTSAANSGNSSDSRHSGPNELGEADEKQFELFLETRESLSRKSVKQLKGYLKEVYKVDLNSKECEHFNIVEKKDLVDFILKLQNANRMDYNPKWEKIDPNNQTLYDKDVNDSESIQNSSNSLKNQEAQENQDINPNPARDRSNFNTEGDGMRGTRQKEETRHDRDRNRTSRRTGRREREEYRSRERSYRKNTNGRSRRERSESEFESEIDSETESRVYDSDTSSASSRDYSRSDSSTLRKTSRTRSRRRRYERKYGSRTTQKRHRDRQMDRDVRSGHDGESSRSDRRKTDRQYRRRYREKCTRKRRFERRRRRDSRMDRTRRDSASDTDASKSSDDSDSSDNRDCRKSRSRHKRNRREDERDDRRKRCERKS